MALMIKVLRVVACAAVAGALKPTILRRALLQSAAPAALVAVGAPGIAGAFDFNSGGSAVEKGAGLPDGAKQFDRFRTVQAEWDRFGARLAKADIDAAEWEGVPSFLRRLYDAGDDMVFMSKGFPAKENKAKAEALAKEFRATIRAVDRPAQAKDRDAVLAAYKATAANMATFLELSSDVPEEL